MYTTLKKEMRTWTRKREIDALPRLNPSRTADMSHLLHSSFEDDLLQQ